MSMLSRWAGAAGGAVTYIRYLAGMTSILEKLSAYLQVNALYEWIIGIYLRKFTNNEREISIPHEALLLVHFQWTSLGKSQ